MLKTLCIPDSHVEDSYLEECEAIFQEIYEIAEIRRVKRIIHLGDFFNKKRLSPKEVEFGIRWTLAFRQLVGDEFYIIVGNHCELSDEINTIKYLGMIGANIADDFTFDNIYYGHCMTEESLLPHNKAGTTKYEKLSSDLAKYDYYVLGHQHIFQQLKGGYHLGSMRYCNFGEVKEPYKQVLILNVIENDISETFIPLTTPIPMKDVNSIEELVKIDSNTKVRIVYKSFSDYKKEVNALANFKNRFVDFKLKLDFERKETIKQTETANLEEIISNWLNNVKDEDVKRELANVFKEHNSK